MERAGERIMAEGICWAEIVYLAQRTAHVQHTVYGGLVDCMLLNLGIVGADGDSLVSFTVFGVKIHFVMAGL